MVKPKAEKPAERTEITEVNVLPPVVFTALGAAIIYYTYPFIQKIPHRAFLFLGILFLFIVIIAFLRVLSGGHFIFLGNGEKNKVPRIVREINSLTIALIMGFCIGIPLRAGVTELDIPLRFETVTGLTGFLGDDPRAFNDGRGMGTIMVREAAGEGGVRITARGKTTVFFPAGTIPRLKEFGRGSEIYIEGSLINNGSTANSSGYDRVVFRASQVHILKPAPAVEQFRTSLRTGALQKFGILSDGSSVPPVWGGLASAMLLGVRDDLDVDLAAAFRNAGCSHVLSLSGMNLALLSGVIVLLFRFFFGIRPASLAGAIFILFYIFLAGAQPSLVRSGIIYFLGTLALWGYLRKNALSLLALAFLIQLFIQNESGVTISFILSYLAIAGILATGNTVRGLLSGKIPDIILTGFSASIGAFLFTAAVASFYFGVLNPVGLLAGIIIMPVATIFMFFAFVSLIFISIIPVLFQPLGFLLTIIYRVLEFLVNAASQVPGIRTSFAPVLAVSVSVIVLLEIIKIMDRRHRKSVSSFGV